MRSRQKNQWWLAKRGLFLVNLAIFVLISWGLAGEYVRHRRLTVEIIRLQTEAERLESRNFEAVKLGQHFAADEAMEREARLKLGLRKPGESVIIVKDVKVASLPTESMSESGLGPEKSGNNFSLWWNYFFGEEE